MKRKTYPLLLFAAAVLVSIAIAACGGGSNPASPSGSLKLQGLVLQGPSAAAAQSTATAQSASSGAITVTVKEAPSINAKVSVNGTFELDGLPSGTFTLVFTIDGTVVGEIHVEVVEGTTEIKVVVQITDGSVVLIEITFENGSDNDNDNGGNNDDGNNDSKTCMISGGKSGQRIELEGNVASGNGSSFRLRVNGNRASGLVDVNASGASYKCNGQKKSTDCKASLSSGDKVHVRGTLTSCTTSAAAVTATEVKVQK